MIKKQSEGTLLDFSKNLNGDDVQRRNEILLLLDITNAIQINLCQELEELLNAASKYRHEVKHNHKQIKTLLRKNVKNIFDDMPQDGIDKYMEAYRLAEEKICHCLGMQTQDEYEENKTLK